MSKSIENKVLLYGTRNAKKNTTLVASVFSSVYSCIFHLISIACHSLRDRKRSQNETNIAISSNKTLLNLSFCKNFEAHFLHNYLCKIQNISQPSQKSNCNNKLRFSKIFA